MSPNDTMKFDLAVEFAPQLQSKNDPVVCDNIEADWSVVRGSKGTETTSSQLDLYIVVDECDDDFEAELQAVNASSGSDEEEAKVEDESPCEENIKATIPRPDSPVLGPIEFFKKAAVGATGAALLGVGAVLVPFPLPVGIPTMALGAGVLSYEFPETTKKVVDSAKERLVDVLETEEEEEGVEIEELELDEDDSVKTNESKRSIKLKKKIGKHVLPWIKKKKNEDEGGPQNEEGEEQKNDQ